MSPLTTYVIPSVTSCSHLLFLPGTTRVSSPSLKRRVRQHGAICRGIGFGIKCVRSVGLAKEKRSCCCAGGVTKCTTAHPSARCESDSDWIGWGRMGDLVWTQLIFIASLYFHIKNASEKCAYFLRAETPTPFTQVFSFFYTSRSQAMLQVFSRD